jgi:hypothetical protein
MATEELKFALMEKQGKFEIRQYAPYIVAETTVSGRFEWAGNAAFRRLAGYIFGNNRRRDSIAMTAPVVQEPASEKIAMTAPVLQESDSQEIAMTAPVTQKSSGDDWVITFVMPSQYTMDTLPEPLDPDVRLRERPGQLMAAVTYSGTWRKSSYEKKRKQLEAFVEKQGYVAVGPSVFARYNSPATLPFRRRNEVLIPIKKDSPV